MQKRNLLVATLVLAGGLSLASGAVLATEESEAVDCFYESNRTNPLCQAQRPADATAADRAPDERLVVAQPAVDVKHCHQCHAARD